MAMTSFANLPPEIILHFMECLPDVATLRTVVLLNRRFYNIFHAHKKESTLLSVLKNELGDDLLVHAIATHQVEKKGVILPAFKKLSMDHIDIEVANLRQIRDQAVILQSSPRHSPIRITIRDANRISQLWNKISQLSEAFAEDCLHGLSLSFYPMQNAIRYCPVSITEMRRIRHSMYMFHIMSIFCKDLFLDVLVNVHFTQHNRINGPRVAACVNKITRLQRSLVNGFMAPWEMYQVISLQAWLRRQMHDLENERFLSERLTPYILSQGIDCMHHAICIIGENRGFHGLVGASENHLVGQWQPQDKELRVFIHKLNKEASRHPAHTFGMILSRGHRDNSTQKLPKSFDTYTPFWNQRDEESYQTWCHLETPRQTMLGFNLLAVTPSGTWESSEGMLDIWSAALWDPARWTDIYRSMYCGMRPNPWYWVTAHWDSFIVGCRSALDPRMMNGVKGEARKMGFLDMVMTMLGLQ
ncbi:hypothetical protein V8C42DRAFT_314284 [Trichoderma barbatum]